MSVSGKIPAARFAHTPGVDLNDLRGTDPNFPQGCSLCCCAPCTIGEYEADSGSSNAICAWVFCFVFCPVTCIYASCFWKPRVNPDVKGDTIVGAPVAGTPQLTQIHVTSQPTYGATPQTTYVQGQPQQVSYVQGQPQQVSGQPQPQQGQVMM